MNQNNTKTASSPSRILSGIVLAVAVMMIIGMMPVRLTQAATKKTKGYSVSKAPGTYSSAITVKLKAAKGYKVYYNVGSKKLSSKKVIKSGKTKKIKIKKTTKIYVYAVKKSKKMSTKKLRTKSVTKKEKQLKYVIKTSKAKPTATPTPRPGKTTPTPTPKATVTPGTTPASPSSTPSATAVPTSSTKPTATPTPTSAPVDPGKEYALDKVHTGDATFYDRGSNTGAADLDSYEKIYYTAAMNKADYNNGLAGAYIEVTDKDGDKVCVMITDMLPEGKVGDIDLSRAAFKSIEPEKTGRMKVTWKIIALPTNDPVSYVFKPDSTQYWMQVQVRNQVYPIKSVEFLNSAGEYVAMKRRSYNYFELSSPGKGPYTFRVTDIFGHVLVDKDISFAADKEPVPGKANFPK